MASNKKRSAKAGAGAVAAGKAVRENPYVQRLAEDEELRENLRTAFESARKVYGRMSNGKGPVKALTDDKKTQKQLREKRPSLCRVRPTRYEVPSPRASAGVAADSWCCW